MRRKTTTWARGTACRWRLRAARLFAARAGPGAAGTEVIECGLDEEEDDDLGTRHSLSLEAEGDALVCCARRAWCGRHGGDRVRLG